MVAITLFVMIAGGLLQIHKSINETQQNTRENLLLEYEWAYLDDTVRAFAVPVDSSTVWYVASTLSGITYSQDPQKEKTSGWFLRTDDGSLSHRITPLTNSTASGSVNTYQIKVWITWKPESAKTIYTSRAYE